MSDLAMLSLIASVVVLCGTLGQTSENDSNSSVQNGGNSSDEKCDLDLYVSRNQMKMMRSCDGLFFETMFKLTKFRKRYTFSERCGDYDQVDSPVQGVCMSNCSAKDDQPVAQSILPLSLLSRLRKSASHCESCCVTTMSISIPWTVTDLYSTTEYTVKHMPSSYQLLNLGHCADQDAACGYGGNCDQTYRVEWILVTTPSGDKFVPTSVPNHCTCVYT